MPAQDLLNLDTEHRMNFPGKSEGNWAWRLRKQMSADLANMVRELTLLYGRCSNPPEQALPKPAKPPLY